MERARQRKVKRQTDKQTDRQTDRPTDRDWYLGVTHVVQQNIFGL